MTTRYEHIMRDVHAGKPVLIDGATGSEVDRRGVAQIEHSWNAGGTLSHPDIVRGIHEDYIRAGARIVISNTFATHRSCLEDGGVGDDFVAYNQRSVELACEARERLGAEHVLVAGGMSHWSFSGNKPSIDVLHRNALEQASIFSEAGAELLMLEMMVEIERMTALIDAALQTGLPVWAGITCKLDEQENVTFGYDGESLADAVAVIRERNIPLINVMHTEVNIVDRCLDALAELWQGPVGVYAHSSDEYEGHWDYDASISPQDYSDCAKRWLGKGVTVIGGCCGVGPEHIQHLSDHVID